MRPAKSEPAIANHSDLKPGYSEPLGQLHELVGALEEHSICYWLDSGTLLGIIREGQLLSSDPDIDIGIWWQPNRQLQPLLKSFGKMGYSVRSRRYKGQTYLYQLLPTQDGRGHIRSIDLKLYRPYGEFAWCPAIRPTDRFKTSANASRFARRMQIGVSLSWMYLMPHVSPKTWPLSFFVEVCCWWVPGGYFRKVIRLDDGVCVPCDYENYLEYRYGNWKIPVINWNFETDDQAFRHMPPEVLFRSVDYDKR